MQSREILIHCWEECKSAKPLRRDILCLLVNPNMFMTFYTLHEKAHRLFIIGNSKVLKKTQRTFTEGKINEVYFYAMKANELVTLINMGDFST